MLRRFIRRFFCLRVNPMARLDFELVYYDVKVQHVNHNATGTHCKNSEILVTLLCQNVDLLLTFLYPHLFLFTTIMLANIPNIIVSSLFLLDALLSSIIVSCDNAVINCDLLASFIVTRTT